MKKLLSLVLFVFVLFLASCSKSTSDSPKYVFLFVGDGMGMNAVTLAEYAGEDIAFSKFESFGNVTTHNASSEITDSASAATAFATGKKTEKGMVGVNKNGKSLHSLTDFFKSKDMKVGLVSSQAVNHATPAAFYAHNKSRYNYYEIGLDFISSKVDLFAGAGFLSPEGDKGNLYDLANGRIMTNGKEYLPYEIDRSKGERSLADYLYETILTFDGEEGFFIMCEGGRIDSACHMNDAATALREAKAFSDAVDVALGFYKTHPEDTLIIVTADHETGGLSLGYTATEYDIYPEVLKKQKISCQLYAEKYVPEYISNGTPFEKVLSDAEELFGLTDMTEYEKKTLFYAYDLTVKGSVAYTTRDWLDFSDKNPLAVAMAKIVASRAGVSFTTFYHTASPVGIWAKGVGEEKFTGFFDNTDIYYKIKEICD